MKRAHVKPMGASKPFFLFFLWANSGRKQKAARSSSRDVSRSGVGSRLALGVSIAKENARVNSLTSTGHMAERSEFP